jgi:hypothetical protein
MVVNEMDVKKGVEGAMLMVYIYKKKVNTDTS